MLKMRSGHVYRFAAPQGVDPEKIRLEESNRLLPLRKLDVKKWCTIDLPLRDQPDTAASSDVARDEVDGEGEATSGDGGDSDTQAAEAAEAAEAAAREYRSRFAPKRVPPARPRSPRPDPRPPPVEPLKYTSTAPLSTNTNKQTKLSDGAGTSEMPK